MHLFCNPIENVIKPGQGQQGNAEDFNDAGHGPWRQKGDGLLNDGTDVPGPGFKYQDFIRDESKRHRASPAYGIADQDGKGEYICQQGVYDPVHQSRQDAKNDIKYDFFCFFIVFSIYIFHKNNYNILQNIFKPYVKNSIKNWENML